MATAMLVSRAAEAAVAAVRGRCGKRPHGEIGEVQLAVFVFFSRNLGNKSVWNICSCDYSDSCFCSFFFWVAEIPSSYETKICMKISKKTGVASSIVWSLAGQRTLFFFCLVSLGQSHGDKPKGNGQRTTVHSVTTSNLLVFQKYDHTEKKYYIF